jgi:hypothetical protein
VAEPEATPWHQELEQPARVGQVGDSPPPVPEPGVDDETVGPLEEAGLDERSAEGQDESRPDSGAHWLRAARYGSCRPMRSGRSVGPKPTFISASKSRTSPSNSSSNVAQNGVMLKQAFTV